ncbi:MAG TPA: hypothetical protein VF692_10095 [Pyrinomonadaceae bacterium]|jgi:hypothetical protein
MSKLDNQLFITLILAIVTASLSALFAVCVFVIGQFVQRFILEPIQEQRKIIGEIAFSLLFHANVSDMSMRANKGLVQLEEPNETVKTLRSLAGRLRATLHTIPFYNFFSRLKFVPSEDDIKSASQSMVGWSNSIYSGDTDIHKKSITEHLKIGKD